MTQNLVGTVTMPPSKSESNRILMIAAYGGFEPDCSSLSEANDTLLLRQLLHLVGQAAPMSLTTVDCGDAGTVSRFLLTYLAGKQGVWRLTGSERMRQRPMAPLVDALRELGADIVYEQQEGFLPLRVTGKPLVGGSVSIDASQSSQFVSSLLLAAPMWREGLSLKLLGDPSSMPYIHLSIGMMRTFGAEVFLEDRTLTVSPKPYVPMTFQVGGDWSAASYWYEMAALSDSCDLVLEGLQWDSLQGDSKVADWFLTFGVYTSILEHGVRLTKKHPLKKVEREGFRMFEFAQTPDLFPAVFATCVALGVPSIFQGVKNLSLKESNRVESMIAELSKVYTLLYINNDNEIVLKDALLKVDKMYINKVCFNTHLDHRIVMAIASLCQMIGEVRFDFPDVVAKSYPSFWDNVKKIIKTVTVVKG